MGTDKPFVSILMAVYDPDLKWFEEQLKSIDNQDFSDMELLICDDCPNSPLDEKLVAECLKKIPYVLVRNEENLGSNKTFERLTELGHGKYFSYCDQDDVWHSDKVSRMVGVLEKTGSPLVCSDLRIIDGEGNLIADSITKIRKRHMFLDGENLAGSLLVRNFVTGCAMMIRADVAKSAVPFVDSLVHDHWLAINAALCGRIEVIREPLIDYRQHGGNQTGILHGIKSKADYYEVRIENMRRRIEDYKARLFENDEIRRIVPELEEFNEARARYFYGRKRSDLKIMKARQYFMPQAVRFEKIMPFLPERLAEMVFKMIRRGRV